MSFAHTETDRKVSAYSKKRRNRREMTARAAQTDLLSKRRGWGWGVSAGGVIFIRASDMFS